MWERGLGFFSLCSAVKTRNHTAALSTWITVSSSRQIHCPSLSSQPSFSPPLFLITRSSFRFCQSGRIISEMPHQKSSISIWSLATLFASNWNLFRNFNFLSYICCLTLEAESSLSAAAICKRRYFCGKKTAENHYKPEPPSSAPVGWKLSRLMAKKQHLSPLHSSPVHQYRSTTFLNEKNIFCLLSTFRRNSKLQASMRVLQPTHEY